MRGAFRGDPAVKAALLARLRKHADAGTLLIGATSWDGTRGSALGVSVEGGDSTVYAERFGYPPALAGLLDPLVVHGGADRGIEVALEWVSSVTPGADLSPVPMRIVEHVLVEMQADRLAKRFFDELRALYRAEVAGARLMRSDWSALRAQIEQAMLDTDAGSDLRAALDACAIACWSLQTSVSVLATTVAAWVRDSNRRPDPAFGSEEKARAHVVLEQIYHETQPLRAAGEAVDIPSIFRRRAPALAAAFEANLDRCNARHGRRAREAAAMVLTHLAAASGTLRVTEEHP